MANTVLSTTYQTYGAKGLREDLDNAIYNISPGVTPFQSMIGRVPVSQTLHEWQTESLASVDTANAQIQGVNYTEFATQAATSRVGNYTQILTKLISVSRTLNTVSKAGRAAETAHQTLKRTKEMKRDLEAILLTNQAGSVGNATTAAYMATMGAWLKTNTDISATSSGDPIYTSGVPAAARTDGTTRALSETLFKNVLQKCATAGAEPTFAMFGPTNKQNASKFAGIATKTQTFDTSKVAPMPIIGASDIYISDFGRLSFVFNRFQRDRDAWIIDPEYLAVGYLTPFTIETLAKTGDAENTAIVAECTLVVQNEAAHGLVADLNITIQ
jgi:hypothetical protein